MNLYGGIDLGGTKIYSIVAGADGSVLGEDERPTLPDHGLEVCIERMTESLAAAASSAGTATSALAAVGVAAPGPIEFRDGIVSAAPNLGWTDVPLRSFLSDRLGVNVVLENDANAAAYGEFIYGAGTPYDTIIYVTVSTGIGGGFILDRRLFQGASGAAAEVGHMVVEPDGPICNCGSVGCLEMLASGTAIGRSATAAVEGGRDTILRELAADPTEVTAEVVAEAAARGDAVANEILDDAARYIGIAFGTLINLLNPQAIIVGGGVSRLGARMIEPITAEARRRSFRQSFEDCLILPAALGRRVGALGTVALAADA
ncbi:MAG: ROK family protein [Dehalococcoidia bacterium]|nr:ROK family protein [Dehalococcoidia bacterium]